MVYQGTVPGETVPGGEALAWEFLFDLSASGGAYPFDRYEMTKTLKIEGMMCEHCEARVRKALEAVDGVESAKADRNTKTAVVTLSREVADDVLAAAVTAQDYEVLGVE